ncbi:MAG TPA: hypothetical protein VEG64_00645 [Candidatus Sulfotelmatobacter sp.]|nr:hypothetical protein [Candidatus Sulfotelmatobacter sp.]
MNPISAFSAGIGVTLLLSVLVVKYLRSPLKKILVDLCGTSERAGFWLAFTNVALVLVPLAVALRFRPLASTLAGFIFDLSGQLEGALVALIFTVIVLGLVLNRYIPSGKASGSGSVAKS